MICGIIAPRQSDIVGHRGDGYLAECILPYGYHDKHLVRTPEGKFFVWEDDWDCDCCKPDEDDRCYVWKEISEPRAIELGYIP